MGLEDRDYLRDEARRYGGGSGGGFFSTDLERKDGQKRVVTTIVIICAVLYLLDAFTPPVRRVIDEAGNTVITGNTLFNWMALRSTDVFSSAILSAPWNLYQLLSYGFAHASMTTDRSIFHILGNMFILWMLGRSVEDRLGRKEFTCFYLSAIVFTGCFWGLFHLYYPASMVGASGAVTAVVVLFAFYFPHAKLLLFGVFPMPGWLLGVLVVGQDFLAAISNSRDNVAYEAHLGGALFAAAYFYLKIRLENWVPNGFSLSRLKKKPKLRVHDPDDDEPVDEAFEKDQKLADEILEKVHREGQDSLTRKERKILERFSRRVRKKNQF